MASHLGRAVRLLLAAALLVLPPATGAAEEIAAEETAAEVEDFYLFTLSEAGQYEASRFNPFSRTRSDANARLGPFETTIRLDPVEETGTGWFRGDAPAEWRRRMDLFWAAIAQDRELFESLEGADLSELPASGRELTEDLRDQWRLTIEPRIRQHEALERHLPDVAALQRAIAGLRLYRFQDTPIQRRFSGGSWTGLARDETFVYETEANAEGWSRQEGPGAPSWDRRFAEGTGLLVWRFEPEDMRRIGALMANWDGIAAAIGPQRDRSGQDVLASAVVGERPVYGGDYDWFVRFFREGLEIVMGAAWTLTPHPLPDRLRLGPGGPAEASPDAGGPSPLQFEAPALQAWQAPPLGEAPAPTFQEPPGAHASGTAVQENWFFTIGSYRQAISSGTPLELPPIATGTLMRLETTHSPIVHDDFRVEGRTVQTGDGYRDERRHDGTYRPWDSVGAIPSPVPLPWQVLGIEQRRAQLNATTGIQATNFTSPERSGWGYIEVNGEVPDDALVGELVNHWQTDSGESFRTQLGWRLLHNGTPPEIATEKMDLRIVRLVEGEYLPIEQPLAFGAHFFIEGRLEDEATREAYVVSFALPDGEFERAVLSPTEEDRRLLRSEMHYLIWDTADAAEGE